MRRAVWLAMIAALVTGGWLGARSPAVPAGAFELKRQELVVTAVPVPDRLLAITFDDGPSPRYTPRILAVLDRYDARATFFVTGRQAAGYPELVRAIAAAGHELGSHGYTHRDLRSQPTGTVQAELDQTAAVIRQATGRSPTLFRAPYGHLDDPLVEAVVARGYRVIHWTCDGKDGYTRTPATEIFKRIRHCPPGGIILLHERGGDRTPTVRALEALLQELAPQGYRFVTVSELLAAGRTGGGVK